MQQQSKKRKKKKRENNWLFSCSLKKKTKSAAANEKGQMAMFQLEKRLHYHRAGWEQYISRADHWISRLAGKGIWSIMKQPIDFGSPYLQKLAQGKWKFSSPCPLIECNFVFNAARTHTTCFLLSPADIWEYEERLWNAGKKKMKTKNRTNYTKQCGLTWKRAGPGVGEGVWIVFGWDCDEESLKYVKCQIELVFYCEETHWCCFLSVF